MADTKRVTSAASGSRGPIGRSRPGCLGYGKRPLLHNTAKIGYEERDGHFWEVVLLHGCDRARPVLGRERPRRRCLTVLHGGDGGVGGFSWWPRMGRRRGNEPLRVLRGTGTADGGGRGGSNAPSSALRRSSRRSGERPSSGHPSPRFFSANWAVLATVQRGHTAEAAAGVCDEMPTGVQSCAWCGRFTERSPRLYTWGRAGKGGRDDSVVAGVREGKEGDGGMSEGGAERDTRAKF